VNIRSPNTSFWKSSIEYTNLLSYHGDLSENIIVNPVEFTDSYGNAGFRILICGTIIGSGLNQTYAEVFNTLYNKTEGIYISSKQYNEKGVGILYD